MPELQHLHCEACDKSTTPLNDHEINELLPEVDGWQVINDQGINKLTRQFNTKNYGRSIAFSNAVAELADSVNHHPLMVVEYGSVTVVWWSHNIKGLHKNDFIMAAKTSSLF